MPVYLRNDTGKPTGARSLEAKWEKRLAEQAAAEAEFPQREQQRPQGLSEEQPEHIRLLGTDLSRGWDAPSTTDRDRKELLRSQRTL